MSIFVVDVEADGPCPGEFSMISLGAVKVDHNLTNTFYAEFKPISDRWVPEALAVSGFTREQTMEFQDPSKAIEQFAEWVLSNTNGRAVFVSDNNGFDWQFVNYYFWRFIDGNPFGHSSRRIGDFYSGLEKDWFASSKWKRYRKTKHTHNPVDDALGNAEALRELAKKHNVRIPV